MNPPAVIALRLVAGLALSAAIGAAAYRRRSLSRSGIAGAILTGTLTFGLGGLMAGLLLIAFFVSSSALSHYKQNRKAALAETFDKTGRRDLGQVLANGGAAALFAVISGLALLGGGASLPAACLGAVVGALAAANADTWATELGVLSKRPPRLITHPGRVVAPGTSGGVTMAGMTAAVAGAGFIGLVQGLLQQIAQPGPAAPVLVSAVFWYNMPATPAHLALVMLVSAVLAGTAGSLLDSLLGATVQAAYAKPGGSQLTERRFDRDGRPNRLARGWRWMTNDWVNFTATLAGAGFGALIAGASLL